MDLFTDSERYKILTNFYEIVDEPKALKKFPFSKFKLAVSGMYLGDIKEERKNKIREYCGDEYKSKKELYDEIMEAYHEANNPICSFKLKGSLSYGLILSNSSNTSFSSPRVI